MRSYIRIFSLIFAFLILTQCKSSKKAITTTVATKSAAFLTTQLKTQVNSYEWLKLKVRLHYRDQYQSMRGTARIRARKDSLIWMNVTKFGIEGMRVLISKNSVEVLNRLDKTYQKESFKELNKNYGLDITFEDLQNLLIGNPIIHNKKIFKSHLDSTGYLLTNRHKGTDIEYHLRPLDFLVDYLRLTNKKQGNLLIWHDEYAQLSDKFDYPKKRRYISQQISGAKTEIDLNIVRAEIDISMNIPFSIPSHYERI